MEAAQSAGTVTCGRWKSGPIIQPDNKARLSPAIRAREGLAACHNRRLPGNVLRDFFDEFLKMADGQ